MGVWRGYYSPIPRGEVYIFAVSVAVLLYFFRSKTNKKDQIYKIFRYLNLCARYMYFYIICIICDLKKTGWLLGGMKRLNILQRKTHNPKHLRETTDDAISDRSIRRSSARHKFNILWKSFEAYKYIINSLKAQSKDASCPHPYSCAHYILAVRAAIYKYSTKVFVNTTDFLSFLFKG